MGGLGLVKPNKGLGKYKPDPDACWINRGDSLLTYEFGFFQNEKQPRFPFFNDLTWERAYEIVSPVSGLHISMREEQTVGYTYGLQYQWCDERALPVILVPHDEPPPDTHNFYVYDDIARLLSDCFSALPIRDYSKSSPERLRGWIDRSGGSDSAKFYLGCLNDLRERNADSHRAYEIREISAADDELVRNVQHLRTKNFDLREKLIHIARKYGEAIVDAQTTTETIPAPTQAYDIALSFAGEDRAIARQLAGMLRQADFRVFYDEYQKAELWGKDLYVHLSEVYRNKAKYCVMFISQHYSKKLWTNHERKAAQERSFRESREYILPLRLDDTELPGILDTTGYVDLRETRIEEVFEVLSQKLKATK